MNEHESWPQRWRVVRPSVPGAVRARVLARVNDELAKSGIRSQSWSWSWLAVAAAALVIWIHASWGVLMAEPAPHASVTISSLESHRAALLEAAAP